MELNSFFANVSWPLYLILSIGVPIPVLIHVVRKRNRYPVEFMMGMFMISYSSVMAGLVKIDEIRNGQLQIADWLPLPGLLGLPLILVAAYKKTRDDTEKRRYVVRLIIMLSVVILFAGFIVILSLLQR